MREVIEAKGTNGRVTFDGALVTIHRGGARAWLRGTGIKSIPAWVITAVELKPAGLGRGWISFGVASGDGEPDDEDDGDFEDGDDEDGDGLDDGGGDAFDPARDENTVLFTRGHQREFEDIRRAVKTAMWEASQADDGDFPPTRRVMPAGPDPVQELRRLGRLLDDGVLSRVEFDRAKARLLDRI